jgi:hypothetical protein
MMQYESAAFLGNFAVRKGFARASAKLVSLEDGAIAPSFPFTLTLVVMSRIVSLTVDPKPVAVWLTNSSHFSKFVYN